jgi:hypothetical protein
MLNVYEAPIEQFTPQHDPLIPSLSSRAESPRKRQVATPVSKTTTSTILSMETPKKERNRIVCFLDFKTLFPLSRRNQNH